MKQWKDYIQKHPWVVPLGSVIVALGLAWLCSPSSEVTPEVSASIDTFIPAGFVLVPINVQNSESLDAVFGKFGVVDLFATSQDGKISDQPLVRAVKMLRTPKNPSQFGVLVPDRQASRLVRQSEPFFVVVHRPDRSGMEFENRGRKPTRSIIYEQESE